jgi:hypothetical protein
LKQSVAVVSFGPTGFIFTRIQPVGPVLLNGFLRGWAEARLIPVVMTRFANSLGCRLNTLFCRLPYRRPIAKVSRRLRVFEEFTQAHFGGRTPAETTGKFIAAQFEHVFARPDAAGYAAPQLHTHVVIMNMTETAAGQVRPLQPLELYRSQRLATAVYRAELADRLRGLGYELVIDPKTGAPEIKGFSREHLLAQSPRSAEVRRGAEDLKLRLEQEGATVSDGAGLRQAAARLDRAGKTYDPTEMRRRAREAVTFAREHSLEREALVDRRSMLTEALRRGQGMTDYKAVNRAKLHAAVAALPLQIHEIQPTPQREDGFNQRHHILLKGLENPSSSDPIARNIRSSPGSRFLFRNFNQTG